MKNITAVKTALEQDHAIRAIPELTVDWNMNRYIDAEADNTPIEDDEGYDVELFPIESIIEPIRPTKGINKARVGMSIVGDDYKWDTGARNGRFYVTSVDDKYKYWTSPEISNTSGVLANCAPQVVYEEIVTVNKIVITTENSWATAKTFNIQVTNVAEPGSGDWTTVATQAIGNAWKASGQIVLYWTGSAWSAGARSDNADGSPKTTTIRGVRIVVTALEGGYKQTDDNSLVLSTYKYDNSNTIYNTDGKESYFDLIEISARLEVDLSKYVVDTGDTFDLGETSHLYPIGTLTSNIGDITLSNLYFDGEDWVPGLFSVENSQSPYRNYIDANAEMNLRYLYFDEDDNYLGTVQQFKMYTNTWNGQDTDAVVVDLSDHSKFFNENKPLPMMWENLTVAEILWRLMDSIGFVDYHIDQDDDRVTDHVIPVFWTNGEDTVWDVLDQLAQASQSAIYFDGNGVLQIKTRDFALDPDADPVWTFNSVTSEDKLADIESMEQQIQFEPNAYTVSYQKTNWQPAGKAIPTTEIVWEPEGTVTLRATPLIRSLTTTTEFIAIEPSECRIWPYEGVMNIEGEFIKFKGKEYAYRDAGGVERRKVITSDDEHKAKNKETPIQYQAWNHYTGRLAVEERGYWNTDPRAHNVDTAGYSVRSTFVRGNTVAQWNNAPGFKHLKQQSVVRLQTNNQFQKPDDLLIATRGTTDPSEFYWRYGTRLRLVGGTGDTDQRAGLVFHNSGNEDGYYLEISSKPLTGKDTATQSEIMFYTRNGNKMKSLVGNGRRAAIANNLWYEVDISFRTVSGNHVIRVNINGKEAFSITVAGSDRQTPNGRFGMFARGKTTAEFEYLYATKREGDYNTDLPEDFSFLDKIQRGYVGNQLDREVVWGWVTNRRIKKKKRKKRTKPVERRIEVYDEFGPYVHEVREYDVKFDPNPVQSSRLFMTNDWSAITMEYRANPFGAKFIVANTTRHNAVMNGEDKISASGTGDAIQQHLSVIGRSLLIGEAETVKTENEDQIRRRGKNESEIANQWVQSKAMAQDVADWLNTHWSYGNDTYTMTVFGNPLIEVGDVIEVNYPEKHVSGDFHVISVENSFEAGIETSMTIRRRV